MTIKHAAVLALLVIGNLSLTGCGVMVPLAVVAIQAAPEIIEEISAARRQVPPVQAAPAVPAPAARHEDDAPLIEPDDVAR